MDSKLSLKKIFIIATLSVLLLLFLSITTLFVANIRPTLCFYGVSERNVKAISSVVETTSRPLGLKPRIIVLNDKLPLEKSLKKVSNCKMLFTYNGLNCDYISMVAVKKNTGLPYNVLDGVTSSVKRTALIVNDKVFSIPLLSDNLEIDVNTNQFISSGIQNINFLKDIQSLADKTKGSTLAPITLAFGDDEMLIDIFGALTEATKGIGAFEEAVIKIRKNIATNHSSARGFSDVVYNLIGEEGECYEANRLLQEWVNNGLVSKNYLGLSFKDTKTYMESGLTTITCLSLSQHRELERNVISKYTSIYYPSLDYMNERHFCSSTIMAVPLSRNKKVRKLLTELVTTKQGDLCKSTGLAPVQSSSSTPDKQSDDVRYWVASSSYPLTTLSRAAFTSKSERTAFAEALRSQIK